MVAALVVDRLELVDVDDDDPGAATLVFLDGLLPRAPVRELRQRIEARVHAQIDALNRKDTREGKPFYEAIFSDAEAKMTLRAWSDAPAFAFCENGRPGTFVEVAGVLEYGFDDGEDGGFGPALNAAAGVRYYF